MFERLTDISVPNALRTETALKMRSELRHGGPCFPGDIFQPAAGAKRRSLASRSIAVSAKHIGNRLFPRVHEGSDCLDLASRQRRRVQPGHSRRRREDDLNDAGHVALRRLAAQV